ncbi:uncharacterized protein [Choristoneura fumiferana]|uniref:uncharacterized protein n=1 Tax=Choristoneura fumiferana TaxID=7141 RepID=UPI003D15A03A
MYIFVITLHVMLLSTVTIGTRNVGTVLFTRDDVQNRKWNKDTLALLKARMYFQRVVPPFSSPRADVPEYVTGLLRYLRNSYATIRKESADKETDRILTIAFTDVIGGYLKMFALPIAKYAYYGGTLPKEDTLKLFLFYEDAKRYLHHNGSTWARPDVTLLNSVTINVANTPFAFINARHKQTPDPCVFLSYFEKTPTGLTIPTPRIDWSSCTMFIPLANHSFVNLYSAKRATDLHKYYNIATNCVRMKRPSSLDKFTERFQSWLQGDVVPHLNDDHLYPALQGILSLINNTGSVAPYSVLNNVMNEINNDADQIGLDLRITSKKMAIIIIIVLLELAWCIPTLLFVLYKNVKRERSRGTTRTSFIFRSQSSSNGCHGSDGTDFTPKWHVKKRRGGLRLKQKPYTMMEVGAVYSSFLFCTASLQHKFSTPGSASTPAPCSDDKILKTKRISKARASKCTTEENALKYKTGDKPYLEIRIDRPKQGISVGVSRKEEKKDLPKADIKSFNRLDSKAENQMLLKSVVKTETGAHSKTDNAAPNKTNIAASKNTDIISDNEVKKFDKIVIPKTDCKVSKIPKRATSPQTIPCSVPGQSAIGTSPRYNVPKEGTKFKKSMIPKLKRAKDDCALKRERSAKFDKLNITL